MANNGVEILNSFPECEKDQNQIELETGDGGTTNRFHASFSKRKKLPNEYGGSNENAPNGQFGVSLKWE